MANAKVAGELLRRIVHGCQSQIQVVPFAGTSGKTEQATQRERWTLTGQAC